MKILITGGRGFLGSNLVPFLSKKHEVTVYDLVDKHDIFSDELESFIERTDVVIHLAALTSVADSFLDPMDSFYVNVIGSSKVAELCVKHQKKLVYPSSDAVFAPELSPYAKSKYVAEEAIKGLIGKTDITILRFVNMFGPHMNKRSGSMMFNFLNRDKIVVYGDGEQTRDFIHVRDVVSIIEDTFKKKWSNRVVDVGMGQPYTTNYIAGLFAHFRGIPISYEPPKREMRWHIQDVDLLKSLYKKKLTTNLEKDIKELCQTHSMLSDNSNKQ
jgi:UDP-glucose 4-epimerase